MANPFTPEQISQILEEFFKVVGTRQYIGARYVPIFGRKDEESIEWDNSAPYEPFTIVLYQGNSYTSRQYVPVGIEITNEKFWALTGNYNAQVEAYRQEVRNILPYDETPTEGSTKGVTSDGIKKAIQSETDRSQIVEQDLTTEINNIKSGAAQEFAKLKGAAYLDTTPTVVDDATLVPTSKAVNTAIANEVTRAKEAEQTNATAIANEVTRAKEAEQTNADTIKNLVFTNPLYGVCHIASTNTWKYISTYDFSSIGTMGNMPSRNDSYDYSDASNLFEHNGILYYPQDSHNDIYATRDGETWESGYGINFPTPLANGYKQWAPMLFEDKDGNVKLAMARQYNSETVTNANGSNTYNFRIDVFDCAIGSDGRITISNNYVTVLSAGTHIDPYITYTSKYGYIMACKNEETCQIGIYSGDALTNMSNKASLPYICCEAPKFIVKDNLMTLYTHAYNFRTGNPTNPGDSIGNFYLSTAINLDDFSFTYMDAITCPSNYRHIAFVMNSEVLSRYARKHGVLPYGVNNTSDRLHVVKVSGTDVYVTTAPIKFMLHIIGGNRTITIHKQQFKTNTTGIIYVLGATNNTPTLTDGIHSHVVKDGEVFPIFVDSDGSTYFS